MVESVGRVRDWEASHVVGAWSVRRVRGSEAMMEVGGE